jgi:hypothetical protein
MKHIEIKCPTCGYYLERVDKNLWNCPVCGLFYPVYRAKPLQPMIQGINVETVKLSGKQVAILPVGELVETLKDPLFDKYLKYGPGKYGRGPSTIQEFLELPEEEQAFYIRVFKRWKQEIKSSGLDKKLLEH